MNFLDSRPFTTAFVSGNHENYDALAAYPQAEWHGGRVRTIRPSVLMLERGQVFDLGGRMFFAMGGASSHDIQDGILEPDAPDFLRRFQQLNAQGWSYRQLAEKFGVSSSAIGRRAVQECWHGTDAQRANARLRNLAAGLRRQAEQRLAGELDTREIKELTAVLQELMNLQQTLEGQQPGGSPLRVVLEEETEDWSV